MPLLRFFLKKPFRLGCGNDGDFLSPQRTVLGDADFSPSCGLHAKKSQQNFPFWIITDLCEMLLAWEQLLVSKEEISVIKWDWLQVRPGMKTVLLPDIQSIGLSSSFAIIPYPVRMPWTLNVVSLLFCGLSPPLFTTSNRSNLLRSYSATKLQMQHHSELSSSFLELHLEFKNAYFADDNIHVVLLLLRPFCYFIPCSEVIESFCWLSMLWLSWWAESRMSPNQALPPATLFQV